MDKALFQHDKIQVCTLLKCLIWTMKILSKVALTIQFYLYWGTVLKRLEKTESKLESVERRLEKTSSSGSSSESVVRKRIVPQVVRVCHVNAV